jgi:N-methylhydantoinase B/oxoprolinase/acetone carboxylase alpha subunit
MVASSKNTLLLLYWLYYYLGNTIIHLSNISLCIRTVDTAEISWKSVNATTLAIFRHLFASVAEEMGVTLGRAAYSPNIKERLDFSCALFIEGDDGPQMLAQAAHIPVHLGAMPASVQAAVAYCTPLQPGDVVIVNDPYQGGNHLPDITLISPIFLANHKEHEEHKEKNLRPSVSIIRLHSPQVCVPSFYVASRAHHADVGGMSPGSMPLSTELYQEGLIIPPLKLVAAGQRNEALWQIILRNVRTPSEREGDLAAQLAAHTIGQQRLAEIVDRYRLAETQQQAHVLINYAHKMTRAAIGQMPNGRFQFTDYLDDDGQGSEPLPISVTITIDDERMLVDFSGTAPAVAGNLNAVPAIVKSAVAYCVRCLALALLQTDLPMNEGAFLPLELHIPPGSLLDPHPPHAVAAGNVETSQRVVDVVFGALAQALPELVPAASQGTMNNLTFGGTQPGSGGRPPLPFAYYETIGGGAGAGPQGNGGSGLHVHMSNTRNTPIEALEFAYPLRVVEYSLRQNSGGAGQHRGGEGLVRSLEFLAPATATITSERRVNRPYGLQGGGGGENGRNQLVRGETAVDLPGKTSVSLRTGDILRLETPGGGGWGEDA